jgi:hypothetical protein
MSRADMKTTIIDIMIDSGMSEEDAENTILSMSTDDMEQYLEDVREDLKEES